MALTRVDFLTSRNELWETSFTLGSEADTWDLADADLYLQVRTEASHPDSLIELSTVNGRLVIDDEDAREVSVSVPLLIMGQMPAGTFVHDLIVKKSADDIRRRAWGFLVIEPGVTTIATTSVTLFQLRQALADEDANETVFAGLDADLNSPATIAWQSATMVTPGDTLATHIKTVTAKSDAEMLDLFALARTKTP